MLVLAGDWDGWKDTMEEREVGRKRVRWLCLVLSIVVANCF